MSIVRHLCPHAVVLLMLGACESGLPIEAGMGPTPTLPEPREQWIPRIHIAPATGWPEGSSPSAAPGLEVTRFATGLQHPRWLLVLRNGDVLVAEADAPRKTGRQTLMQRAMGVVMKRAGSGTPSADRITLLRDADDDGIAEFSSLFLGGLRSPFGMAEAGNFLYVANTDAIVRVAYGEGDITARGTPEQLAALPAGPINHHWTRNLIANPDGTRLYVTVGSNSNIGENGLDNEVGRAAIWEFETSTGQGRLYASGLRNPNGLAWEPASGQLWTVVNERDGLGDDLVPDYFTTVRENAFYGWPYSYFGAHIDTRVTPGRPDLAARAVRPDYALGSHTGSLGLAFVGDRAIGPLRSGAVVGQHGSWNRRPRSGYKVIFVPFEGGRPSGPATDVLTGFVNEQGEARGRPVGVAIDGKGGLLVADDVGNTIWRITSLESPPT